VGRSGTDTFHVLAISGPAPPDTEISISTTAISFGSQRVGTYGAGAGITIKNTGNRSVVLTSITLSGPHPSDWKYGDAPFYGDAGAVRVADVIGIAGTSPPIPPELAGAAAPLALGGRVISGPSGAAAHDSSRHMRPGD
jgi:hypothetical protein